MSRIFVPFRGKEQKKPGRIKRPHREEVAEKLSFIARQVRAFTGARHLLEQFLYMLYRQHYGRIRLRTFNRRYRYLFEENLGSANGHIDVVTAGVA